MGFSGLEWVGFGGAGLGFLFIFFLLLFFSFFLNKLKSKETYVFKSGF